MSEYKNDTLLMPDGSLVDKLEEPFGGELWQKSIMTAKKIFKDGKWCGLAGSGYSGCEGF